MRISLDYMKAHGRYGQKRGEKVKKTRPVSDMLRLLSRPQVNCFEILWHIRPISGLPCVQILLYYVEGHGSRGWKRPKIGPKNKKVLDKYDGEIFLYRTQMVPWGSWLASKKFISVRFFCLLAGSDIHFDTQCVRTPWNKIPPSLWIVFNTLQGQNLFTKFWSG